jgi:hypothetical protein
VLLPDQDLLLVLSEEGELALVQAASKRSVYGDCKVPAIQGKTWKPSVLVGDVLLCGTPKRWPRSVRSTE